MRKVPLWLRPARGRDSNFGLSSSRGEAVAQPARAGLLADSCPDAIPAGAEKRAQIAIMIGLVRRMSCFPRIHCGASVSANASVPWPLWPLSIAYALAGWSLFLSGGFFELPLPN